MCLWGGGLCPSLAVGWGHPPPPGCLQLSHLGTSPPEPQTLLQLPPSFLFHPHVSLTL